MRIVRLVSLLAASLFIFGCAYTPAGAASFPPPIVPQGFGVNIHFTGAPAKDIDGLAKMGVGWIRMDFLWGGVEKTKGAYDFSAYDTLVTALSAHHIYPLFILDYENPLYGPNSPSTEEDRAAFARFAAAAARHYAGKIILWEIWNEPNISFWKPAPNVKDYAALALATAQAIKGADPRATVIAPGMSTMDFPFVETCFQAGLLKYIDGVSFHPYRSSNPETAAADYATLRGLIARYAPSGKEIPLISSEWGYSSAGVSEEQQAQYLTRQWLSNLEQGIKVSIWYDWHDDGPYPRDGESNFGTVNYDYSPKPAFTAAQTLTHALDGYRFIKRVVTKSDADYLLIFAKGKQYKLAAWTTGTDHTISVPFVGTATLTHMLGDKSALSAHAGALSLPISQSPVYVDVPTGNIPIEISASLTITPAHGGYRATPTCQVTFTNPTSRPIDVMVSYDVGEDTGGQPGVLVKPHQTKTLVYNAPPGTRSSVVFDVGIVPDSPQDEKRIRAIWQYSPFYLTQADFVPADPLSVAVIPAPNDKYYVRIENPGKAPFKGTLLELGAERDDTKWPIALAEGQNEASIWINGRGTTREEGVAFVLYSGTFSSSETKLPYQHLSPATQVPFQRFAPYSVPPAQWRVAADGDAKVESKFDISPVTARAPLNAPAAKLDYTFAPGWSFVRVYDPNAKPLPGKPTGETLWVNGDGSGNALRMRFADSTGQVFQQDFGKCDWKRGGVRFRARSPARAIGAARTTA
ncbi:MAG TPA: cellulase family glycosylhydrolase [Capsulimonadaceae bacterium]|nr:cellulase family glycosylhydrolase [Capsulimonadaceae bacterium]